MSTGAIRQKLHSYLERADDKKVKAIYAIMEDDIEQLAMEYTEEIKQELDKRDSDRKNGKTKLITASESRKRIQKIVKAAKKK